MPTRYQALTIEQLIELPSRLQPDRAAVVAELLTEALGAWQKTAGTSTQPTVVQTVRFSSLSRTMTASDRTLT